MNSWKDWKTKIKNDFGIIAINTSEELTHIINAQNTIITTRCSKTKTGKNRAIPKHFYVSDLNIKFYDAMDSNDYYYGILSDKYGIHFKDEELDYYDIHPSSLTSERKIELGEMIKEKVIARGYESLIFYNTSPIFSKPYFDMLKILDIPVYFFT